MEFVNKLDYYVHCCYTDQYFIICVTVGIVLRESSPVLAPYLDNSFGSYSYCQK